MRALLPALPELAALAGLLLLPAPGCAPRREAARRYVPRSREVTLTAVPLLVHEQQGQFPFLRADFARGGLLEGREVYAFVPSTVTVVEGDTVRFRILNPEDDAHMFVLPGLAVPVPGQRETRATYVAARAGIYPFVCNMPAHAPMMAGELVVLAPGAVAPGPAPPGGAGAPR
ncbi:MAG TPA: cupredoxin domain-containing protein [Candidatus Saccharimonadales bacterium]|nr:cupredoxin domain-containing protein [Candidatus Saccharimonadales bacterium]